MSKQLDLVINILKESFTVKDASGKVVHVALSQGEAKKKAAELEASTKEKHTVGYSREAVVKEETIEELNKSTVDSYKAKAKDEVKQAKKFTKSEYGDLAKRVIFRRTKGLAMANTRNESESLDEMGYGQARAGEHAWSNSGSAMPTKAHKYHVKDRSTGKVVSTHSNAPDAVKARNKVGGADTHSIIKESSNDLNESIIKWKRETVKRHGDVEFIKKSSTGGLNNRTTIARKSGGDILAVYHHATNVGTIFSAVKESSMSDLASGKGDGKELKASPEYRRDRRRTAQMLAAQKEVQARVKRGYAEDDKDLDEDVESIDEARKPEKDDSEPVHQWSGGYTKGNARDSAYNEGHTHGTHKHNRSASKAWGEHEKYWHQGYDDAKGPVKESLDEAKLVAPLKGHVYHTKSDAELRGIVKDAGETAKIQKGMSSEGKYLDQMNDASTVLHYRSKGGKQIMATNPRMVTPKPTEDSIKAKLAKWHKNESVENLDEISLKTKINVYKARSREEYDDDWGVGKDPDKVGDNILRKHGPEAMKSAEKAGHVANFGRTDASGKYKDQPYDPLNPHPWAQPKEHKLRKDGKIHKTETNSLKYDVKNRLKNWYNSKPNLPESVEESLEEGSVTDFMNLVADGQKRRSSGVVKRSNTQSSLKSQNRWTELINKSKKKAAPVKEATETKPAGETTMMQRLKNHHQMELDYLQKNPKSKKADVEHAKQMVKRYTAEDVVEGSIEEVSTALLKSYAEKAREDAAKLTKQGDRARSDTTKLNKYVKATKRHLNTHKANDKISSNEFYGKK